MEPTTKTHSDPGLLLAALTQKIIGAAIEVHRELGPGLLESIYEECMCHALRNANLPLQSQVELPIVYKKAQHGRNPFNRSYCPRIVCRAFAERSSSAVADLSKADRQ